MNVRNPRWNSVGTIDVEIEYPEGVWGPFTADPVRGEHGPRIYAEVMRGEHGPIAPALPLPEPPEEERKELARQEVREQYRRAPPTDLNERIVALEIIIGVKDPVINGGGGRQ